jgi:alkylation response protein AidB-like acyl-CoA dehydrogenase
MHAKYYDENEVIRELDKLSVLSRYSSVAHLLQIVDGTSEIQKMVLGRDLERHSI